MSEKKNLKENKNYSISFFLLIALLVIYLILGQALDVDFALIGGPKYLLIEDNFASVGINKKFSNLELYFKAPVSVQNSEVLKQEGTKREPVKTENYNITSSADNKVISVEIKEDISGTVHIKIYFAALSTGGFPPAKYIKNVVIDNDEIGISNFYANYIDEKNSNVSYYKSFDLWNLSSYLGATYGRYLLLTVMVILVVLLTIQVMVFFAVVYHSFVPRKAIKIGESAVLPLKIIDTISKDFSVVLGFLGTIVAIWTGLEIANFDYSNFFQVLGLIKTAIFTTVLGLLVYIVYSIREFCFSIQKEIDKL